MTTYNDIDEFIVDVMPDEYMKIMKRKKSEIQEFIEKADEDFNKKLTEIIEGKKKEEKEKKEEKAPKNSD
jgi:hypothetical protein